MKCFVLLGGQGTVIQINFGKKKKTDVQKNLNRKLDMKFKGEKQSEKAIIKHVECVCLEDCGGHRGKNIKQKTNRVKNKLCATPQKQN
jgi:hypothetical protein